jgi:hypothetical protein
MHGAGVVSASMILKSIWMGGCLELYRCWWILHLIHIEVQAHDIMV